MFPINSAQPYSRFRRLVTKSKSNHSNKDAKKDSFEETQRQLNRRLQAIRDGFEPGPLTGVNNMSAEDLEVLNDNASKRQRYGVICPECQDAYKENAKRSHEVIPYRDVHKQVEISS